MVLLAGYYLVLLLGSRDSQHASSGIDRLLPAQLSAVLLMHMKLYELDPKPSRLLLSKHECNRPQT